jgi:lysyl-tRNA synthetase class 2
MNPLTQKILQRSRFIRLIREFFDSRGVLEVDTPLIRPYSVTDPYMSALACLNPRGEMQGYLQTSPEYAMKKLLCEGAPDIFQLSKMFRADERSAIHQPEFTMLEWYRIAMSHTELANEVCELIIALLGNISIKSTTYRDAFFNCLEIDPFNISDYDLKRHAEQLMPGLPDELLRDNYLTLLFSELVEDSFNKDEITVVDAFPASQASLAKISEFGDGLTADRFEIYSGGLELANGFSELADPEEQLQRFEQDNHQRLTQGDEVIEIDKTFIASLKNGLPTCSGVALGVDRLMMLKYGATSISEVTFQ